MKRTILLIPLLAILIIPSMTHSQVQTTVFGPEKYIRTSGHPNVYQEVVLTGAEEEGSLALGRLILINGDSKKNSTVRSAVVKLNGCTIFGPNDFKAWVNRLEAPVKLKKENHLYVKVEGIPKSHLTIQIDYETGPQGPPFTGPKQYPFLCRTETAGLGQPLIDNLKGTGIPVYEEDAQGKPTDQILGYSKDCSMFTRVDYFYRSTEGKFKRLAHLGSRPADLAQTTTSAGLTVDYIVRLERGTINRFIYGIAMLAPQEKPLDNCFPHGPCFRSLSKRAPRNNFGWDTSAWNRKLIYQFQGGVGIGHQQGSGWAAAMIDESKALADGGPLNDEALAAGYAVAFSTGTTTDTHYNMSLSAETMMMIKNYFTDRYGKPQYTVGVGGSGGSIQQYFIGQNHPGLLDGGVPQYSYSDMITQTIYVGDCSLLEYYFDAVAPSQGDFTFGGINLAKPFDPTYGWLGSVKKRTLIEGLSSSDAIGHPIYENFGHLGSTECVNGWLGLLPLCMNPLWTDTQGLDQLPPDVVAKVRWTHWNDLENIYGVDSVTGIAPNSWDNVGVQYGLQAFKEGKITREQFLDINAKIGGWKNPRDMIQEGYPFFGALAQDFSNFDPWSIRNSTVFPPNGKGVAPRTTGNMEAMAKAYRSGHVFKGRLNMPVIDFRHYLDPVLNMHHAQQSFATRQRLLDGQKHADNQLIWFAAPYYDLTGEAFQLLDEWIYNIQHKVYGWGVVANKPTRATDQCVDATGAVIGQGPGVWDGILNNKPKGVCTEAFPLFSTSRIVAGGDIKGDVFKCHLIPVSEAIGKGFYGGQTIDQVRLEQIFPDGVCDYSQGDAGRPSGF